MGLARVVILCHLVLAACTPPRVAEAPMPAEDPTRFHHDRHAGPTTPCLSCHDGKRPGSDDHAPCDNCHREAFLAQPGDLCKNCHTKVTTGALGGVSAPLRPYPVEDIWQAEPSKFSHLKHLDQKTIEDAVGFHVSCADCHVLGDKLVRPNHATCARCHAPEASPRGLVTMNDCQTCHEPKQQLRTRARLIRGDLHFDHDSHRADRRGTPIKCEQCHPQSAAAPDYASHPAPRIQSCVGCHDDNDRAPESKRMRVCATCHTGRVETLTTLAPRSHLPATERPIDHTIAFRRDHAEAAERDSARCATCHTQMSGNPRDTCDECHQTMKPMDHRITFRELDHGPEAAADRGRCATCHVVEFCTACHSQRPRSHGFPGSFRGADHAVLARENVRACLTCHVDGTMGPMGGPGKCTLPGCHTAIGAP